MRKSVFSAAVVAGLFGFSNVASAEVPITLNLGMAERYFDSDTDLEDMTTPWASIEYAFDDNWAAEIFYAEDDTELEDVSGDIDVETWQLSMLYYGGSYIGEPRRVRPYLVFGMGEDEAESDMGDFEQTTVHGGVGLRMMFTKRLGARFELRAIHGLDEHNLDTMLSAGLNLYLGNVDAQPEPVSEPVAEAVDSDGDGVTDDLDLCPDTPAGTRVDTVGCPLAVARVASIKLNVNFAYDSSVVQERYFSDLSELAEFLQRFEDMNVDIEGHTDSSGSDDYNKSLSQRRAQAVVDLLVNQHGIAAERLTPVGYGESSPIASNETEEGRARNRRVVATLEVEYE